MTDLAVAEDEVTFEGEGHRRFAVSRFQIKAPTGAITEHEERIRIPLHLAEPKNERECYLLGQIAKELTRRVERRKKRG